MDYEPILKKFRKNIIAGPEQMPVRLDFNKDDIKKIIPHREPFLLIDRLTGIDPENEIICGETYIDPELPLFRGHFPEYPVYPGCLQIEMTGQLGLCMYYFISNDTREISGSFTVPDIRATKVLGAHYLAPVEPGNTVQIAAQKLESDDYFASVIGQITVNGKIACVAVSEVCFLD